MKNKIKEKLRNGEAVFGSWVFTNSFDNAQIMSYAGADCIMIDGEHGSMDIESAGLLVSAIRTGPAEPLLRVPWNDLALIKRGLDTGCAGIMIPMVSSPEDADRAVSCGKYPPVGGRGMGAGRASLFGNHGDTYFPHANDEVAVILQIEHYKAVENVEEIVSTPGIDIAFVGPVDLSTSMGVSPDSPEVIEAFKKVIAACRRYGVTPGVMTGSGNIQMHLDLGFRFLLGGTDSQILYAGAKAIADEYRSCRIQ